MGELDWIIDPYAREFGVGKLSAFTLGYQPYVWSDSEVQWRTPPLADLVLYEINIAEFGGDLERARDVLAYLSDLGENAVEIMNRRGSTMRRGGERLIPPGMMPNWSAWSET